MQDVYAAVDRLDKQVVPGFCDYCLDTYYMIVYTIINGHEYLSFMCMVCAKQYHIKIGV